MALLFCSSVPLDKLLHFFGRLIFKWGCGAGGVFLVYRAASLILPTLSSQLSDSMRNSSDYMTPMWRMRTTPGWAEGQARCTGEWPPQQPIPPLRRFPPVPPRPDFESSKENLQKFGDQDNSITQEKSAKMKQKLEAQMPPLFSLVAKPQPHPSQNSMISSHLCPCESSFGLRTAERKTGRAMEPNRDQELPVLLQEVPGHLFFFFF